MGGNSSVFTAAPGAFAASCLVTRLSPSGLDQTPVVSMRGGDGWTTADIITYVTAGMRGFKIL